MLTFNHVLLQILGQFVTYPTFTWQTLTNPKPWQTLTYPEKHWQTLTNPDKPWQTLTNTYKHWQALTNPDKPWQTLTNTAFGHFSTFSSLSYQHCWGIVYQTEWTGIRHVLSVRRVRKVAEFDLDLNRHSLGPLRTSGFCALGGSSRITRMIS